MRGSSARALLAALVVGAALLAPPNPAVQARGEDACPEPNNRFQEACYLGPESEALGFISAPNDTDAYRIEVLDFNVDVHVEMTDRPLPYRVELADWNGTTVASSMDGLIATTLSQPGSYYIFVDSPTGQFSDSRPYVIFRRLHYPGSKIPDILYSGEFRAGGSQGFTGSYEYADYTEEGGRYTIAMKMGGVPDDPTLAWAWWGPVLTDFTLTVDSRLTNGANAGFMVYFRRADDNNFYVLLVDVRDGQARVNKVEDGEMTGTTNWRRVESIDTAGGVNRVVVHCAADDIQIYINGQRAFNLGDAAHRAGQFGFGAVTWGAPPIINFDNVLVTTPGEGNQD